MSKLKLVYQTADGEIKIAVDYSNFTFYYTKGEKTVKIENPTKGEVEKIIKEAEAYDKKLLK